MTRRTVLPYGVSAITLEQRKRVPPAFISFAAFMCTFLAGLGDWKVLNDTLKGLPKAITLGVIACAFLNFLVAADFRSFRRALRYSPLCILLVVVYTLISMYIWITDFSARHLISRGIQKILFQLISIVYLICMAYLFEERSVNYLFFGMCAANGAIAVLEIPSYGLAESINSVVTCLVTFGEAEGYVRKLEIHDITFLFGQFFIYYMMFAPKETQRDRRIRLAGISLSVFFMLLGLKRSTLPAMAGMCVYAAFVRKLKKPEKLIIATGIALFFFFYLYLYLVRTGILIRFLESLNIDMMGRSLLWSLPNPYYELSPFWKGLGFEGVTDLIGIWYDAGILNRPYPLHNDILRIFIELGAVGFTLWNAINYVVFPLYWIRKHDTETALLYMSILAYMTVTYLTDNTVFYFWSGIGLRLIPISFSYRMHRKEHPWRGITPADAADTVWMVEMEG